MEEEYMDEHNMESSLQVQQPPSTTNSELKSFPTKPGEGFSIELGDIIQIEAVDNPSIHLQHYYVFYVDDKKLKLLNTSTHQILKLQIDGYIQDETITNIMLISRSQVPGFARQHKLLPSNWVDIHFYGDIPTILSAEITNLEEDMIELTTYPERNVLYIDFAYQGVPEHLPIEKIVLRDRPTHLKSSIKSLDIQTDETAEEEGPRPTEEYDAITGEQIRVIPPNVAPDKSLEQIVEEYLDRTVEIPESDLSTQEHIEEELASLTMTFEVLESEVRYSEDIQLTDLMNAFVSKLPLHKRTDSALNDIHIVVSRFKELRKWFSIMDENGNVLSPKLTSELHKPLIERIMKMDKKLGWILPVVGERAELIQLKFPFSPQQKTDEHQEDSPYSTVRRKFLEQFIPTAELNADNVSDRNKYDQFLRTIDANLIAYTEEPIAEQQYVKYPINNAVEIMVNNNGTYEADVSASQAPISRHRRTDAHLTIKCKYLFRCYDTASTRMVLNMNTRQRTFVRQYISGNPNTIKLQSILVMPKPFVMQKQIYMPSASIYLKSKLSETPAYLYRALIHDKSTLETREIENLDEEIQYNIGESLTTSPDKPAAAAENNEWLEKPMHYAMTNTNNLTVANYEKMLNAVIPRTSALLKWMLPHIKHLYTHTDIIRNMEVFQYEYENITKEQYVEIKKYINQKIKQYAEDLRSNSDQYGTIASFAAELPGKHNHNPVMDLLKSTSHHNDVLATYRITNKGSFPTNQLAEWGDSSEILNFMYSADGGSAFIHILQYYLFSSLVLPDSVNDLFKPPSIQSDGAESGEMPMSFNNSDCNRTIAKKYTSLANLQKDNNVDDVFYDKAYDDTPYYLADKYKDDKKRLNDDDLFREFLTETLIQKHDCPPSMAPKLVHTILSKKKLVEEGSYAMLVVDPTAIAPNAPLLSEEDGIEAETKANTKPPANAKIVEYYKRANNVWVRDSNVSGAEFLDTNTLFCKLSEKCDTIEKVNMCVPETMAAMQMKLAFRARLFEEFQSRIAKSFQTRQTELQQTIKRQLKLVQKWIVLRNHRIQRPSIYCYELGKFAKSGEENALSEKIESPHVPLRERIFAMKDFTFKQQAICKFVSKHCTEPSLEEGQAKGWYYCRDTNTKLFPISLYELAKGAECGNYSEVLDRVICEYGEKSDDGDSIVDKYTGYVLRKMDYSAEEGFDDAGFHISTNAMVEKSIGDIVRETLSSKAKTFPSPIAQSAYNVFSTLSENIGLNKDMVGDGMEEFVIRLTLEIMNDTSVMLTEQEHEAAEKRNAASRKKYTRVPYEVYLNQTLIYIVGATTFVAFQTIIPSFQLRKTFPGCVKSFAGYPLDPNPENTPGLKYIACVLDKSKNPASQPWASISKYDTDTLLKRLKYIMTNAVLKREDVKLLYGKKREYLTQYPDILSSTIPPEVSVQKWTTFLPPLYSTAVVSSSSAPVGITEDFERELFASITAGSVSNNGARQINELYRKRIMLGYAVCEFIERIVHKKQLILSTKSGVHFLENACCNESEMSHRPIDYFIQENPILGETLKKMGRVEKVIQRLQYLCKPKLLFDPTSTRLIAPPIPDTIIQSVIYSTIMYYCNFDNDMPIPHYLHSIANEKPTYNRNSTMGEKIQYLRQHGKQYGLEDYIRLMQIVNGRNILITSDLTIQAPPSPATELAGFVDMLDYFADIHSDIIPEQLRTLFKTTIQEYTGTQALHEPTVAMIKLNRYLEQSSNLMTMKITEFMTDHGHIRSARMAHIEEFINTIHIWNIEDVHTYTNRIYNSICNIVKLYPQIALGGRLSIDTPNHNKTQQFSKGHNETLTNYSRWTQAFNPFIIAATSATASKSGEVVVGIFDKTAPIWRQYLERVKLETSSMLLFLKQIPIFSPVIKSGVKYWTFYDDETVRLIYKYCFVSVIYEYVKLASSREFVELRANEIRVAQIASTLDDAGLELANDVRQVAIVDSDSTQLMDQVGKWLALILELEAKWKRSNNFSYADIHRNTALFQFRDKKQITDKLGALTVEQRRVEEMLKTHKLGKWGVGLQAGLYQYDKNVQDTESALWHNLNAIVSVDEVIGPEYEVEQLDAHKLEQDMNTYDGGDDMPNESYLDGNIYEEDYERNDGFDDE